jgi:hypothetical protein
MSLLLIDVLGVGLMIWISVRRLLIRWLMRRWEGWMLLGRFLIEDIKKALICQQQDFNMSIADFNVRVSVD